jgi:uncharacterized membrane protein YgcG
MMTKDVHFQEEEVYYECRSCDLGSFSKFATVAVVVAIVAICVGGTAHQLGEKGEEKMMQLPMAQMTVVVVSCSMGIIVAVGECAVMGLQSTPLPPMTKKFSLGFRLCFIRSSSSSSSSITCRRSTRRGSGSYRETGGRGGGGCRRHG